MIESFEWKVDHITVNDSLLLANAPDNGPCRLGTAALTRTAAPSHRRRVVQGLIAESGSRFFVGIVKVQIIAGGDTEANELFNNFRKT